MSMLGAIACAIAVASLALCLVRFAPPTASLGRATALSVRAGDLLRLRREDAAAGRLALSVLQAAYASLRSGLPLPLALRVAVDDIDAPAKGPFGRVMRAFDIGTPLAEALRAAARGSRDRRLVLALDALSLVAAEQLPAVRSAAVIASVADRLAFEERLLDEIRARTSGLRAQIVLLALLVPALALYLAATLPGLGATLSTPLGLRVLIPGALLFEAAGIIASRRIVNGLSA